LQGRPDGDESSRIEGEACGADPGGRRRVGRDQRGVGCDRLSACDHNCARPHGGNREAFVQRDLSLAKDTAECGLDPPIVGRENFPGRKERKNDSFFDWLHGKWHDSFCPCGPCLATADAIPDPQTLGLKLSVNGTVRQNASTGQQIFPVAAVIEFISNICTLEPGDMISTGTPAGVGNATGTYLHPGDKVEAWIEGIGTLVSPIVAEA